MSESIVLYHAAPSFYSQIVRLAFAEKSIGYSECELDIHMRMDQISPIYAKIHPEMTIPSLKSGKTIVPGSDQILLYLEEKYPNPSLMGNTEEEQQLTQNWINLFYGFPIEELTFSTLLRRIYPLKLGFKWKIGSMIRQLEKLAERHPNYQENYIRKAELMKLRKTGLTQSSTYSDSQIKLEELLKTLQTQFQENGPWLCGDRYSYADVIATCILARIAMIGKSEAFLKIPELESYWHRLKTRPSFREADIWDRFQIKHLIRELSGSIDGLKNR